MAEVWEKRKGRSLNYSEKMSSK